MAVDPSYDGDNEHNALACSDLRHGASGFSGSELRIYSSDIGFRSALCQEAGVVSAAHPDVCRTRRCFGLGSELICLQAKTISAP